MTSQEAIADGQPVLSPPNLSRRARWLASIWRLVWIMGILSSAFIVLGLFFPVPWPMCLITPFLLQCTVAAYLSCALLCIGKQYKKHSFRLSLVAIVCMAVAAVAGTAMYCFNVVPRASIAIGSDAAPALKVLASNVHSENTDLTDLPRLILAEQPDVVLLTEINSEWLVAIDKALSATYPFRRATPADAGNFGMGIWSKKRLIKAQFDLFIESDHGLGDTPELDATLDLGDDAHTPIHIIGLHTLPPLHGYAQRRRDGVLSAAAQRVVDHPEMPAIIMGDFNATPHCKIIRDIAAHANLFDATGGMHVTWPDRWSWPVMGIHIDNILVTDDFALESSHAGADIGSDHWPVIATLRLCEGKRIPLKK